MIVFKSPFPRDITPWGVSRFLLFWLKEDDERIEKLGDFLAFGEGGRSQVFDDKSSFTLYEFNEILDNRNQHETKFYKALQYINSKIKKIDYVKVHSYDTWNGDETLIDIIYPVLMMYKKEMNGSPNVDDDDVPDYLKSNAVSFEHDTLVHQKWEYVVNEMLFAFNPKNNELYHDYEMDKDSVKRMENGRILFGKYMNSLWT